MAPMEKMDRRVPQDQLVRQVLKEARAIMAMMEKKVRQDRQDRQVRQDRLGLRVQKAIKVPRRLVKCFICGTPLRASRNIQARALLKYMTATAAIMHGHLMQREFI